MSRCGCDVCNRTDEWQSTVAKLALNAEQLEFFEQLSDIIIDVESDRDYWKAVVQNKWPSGDAVLAKYRTAQVIT